MNIKLKPCPFCGGKAKIVEDEWYGSNGRSISYTVRCDNISCDMESSTGYVDDEERAIKKWNTRYEGD